MSTVAANHFRVQFIAKQVCDIVFSAEFTGLWKELHTLYQQFELEDAEKEAFQDAFYSFYTQRVNLGDPCKMRARA